MRLRFTTWLCLLCGVGLLSAAGCSDDDHPGADAALSDATLTDGGVDAASADGALDAAVSPDASPTACPRTPGPANKDRKVVISHPYDSGGNQASDWEVFDLSTSGALSATGTTFQMGRAFMGQVRFTPDGEVGLVAQDDGTLGVFTFGGTGGVTVVHAGFSGSFYAADVVMDPAGDGAWVLDAQWRENGGGIYRVSIGCDGTLTDEGLVAASKLPNAFALLPDGSGRAVLAAHDVLDSAAEKDVHLLDWGTSPAVLASIEAFPDDDYIVGSLGVTPDAKYALIGDNQGVFSVDNRVAVVEIGASALTSVQVLTPLDDPIAILTSPFGDTALVVSGMGDALYVLDYTPSSSTAPFAIRGELTYTGTGPQLPGGAVMILRGNLQGRVVISENTGIRMVDFEGGGTVTDLGVLDLGSGLEHITGAVGVQP